MNTQALRSAGSRLKPDVVAVKTCVRSFTTTQLRAADPPSSSSNDNGGAAPPRRPSGRERSRAAANEINELLRSGSTFKPSGLDEKPKVIDLKTLPSRPAGSNFVKLPSSFRGRGRGGAGLGGSSPGAGPQRGGGGFGGRPSTFAGAGRGGFAGRGRGGPRGGGGRGRGGRGGRGGGRKGGRDGEDSFDKNKSDRAEEWERFFRAETREEHAYYRARDHGVPTQFNPSVTAESLLGFAPALALGSSAPAMQSVVLGQLREAAGNAIYDPTRRALTEEIATQLADRGTGMRFFSDLGEKEAFLKEVKETPEEQASVNVKAVKASKLEAGAEKAVREYILDKAIKGKHAPPVFVDVKDRDPMKAAASAHAHNQSYGAIEARKFDAKLASLVARKPAAAAAAPAKRANA